MREVHSRQPNGLRIIRTYAHDMHTIVIKENDPLANPIGHLSCKECPLEFTVIVERPKDWNGERADD